MSKSAFRLINTRRAAVRMQAMAQAERAIRTFTPEYHASAVQVPEGTVKIEREFSLQEFYLQMHRGACANVARSNHRTTCYPADVSVTVRAAGHKAKTYVLHLN